MIATTTNNTEYLIDDDIFNEVDRLKPYYDKSNGYIFILINGKKLYMHRYLLLAKKGEIVDHINRDKLDNRCSNLRITTHSRNNYNRNVVNNEMRGIYYDKYGSRWRACISTNNKTLKLGSFKTIEEAKKAYNKKAIDIYGSLAVLHLL